MSKRLTETVKCETCRWWFLSDTHPEEGYGSCHLQPVSYFKHGDSWCSHWEDKGCEETLSDNGVQVCMTCNYMMPDPSRRLGQICAIWKKQVMEYHWCNRWELVTTSEKKLMDETMSTVGSIVALHRNQIGQEIWL